MSRINSGVLRNAYPLTPELIKELEREVLDNNTAYVYLDENGKLSFMMPSGIDGIKDLAWDKGYELSVDDAGFTKKAYVKTGLKTFKLNQVLVKEDINDSWKELLIPSEGLDYTLNSDGASYSVERGTCTDTDVIIAAEYEGLPVTSIGEWAFSGYGEPTSVVIPDSVTSIGHGAFIGCSNLTNVTIPDSVTSIGYEAFSYCSSLTNVIIPNSITSIEYQVFSDTGLTSVAIPNSVTTIGNGAFSACDSLASATIPNSVTTIEDGAFGDCIGLTSIVFDGTVAQWNAITKGNGWNRRVPVIYVHCIDGDVPEYAVAPGLYRTGAIDSYGYEGDVTPDMLVTPWDSLIANGTIHVENGVVYTDFVPNPNSDEWVNTNSDVLVGDLVLPCDGTITKLGDAYWDENINYNEEYDYYEGGYVGHLAFPGCTNLTGIMIPDSVTSISESAFDRCESLTSVIIGNSVTSISDCAFNCCASLESIEIPNSVTSIGNGAFWECVSLASVIIGNSVTNIDDNAFSNCTSLESIEIPDSVTSIGDSAFEGCESLTSAIIGNSVTSIGEAAFNCCTLLTSIAIPDGVTNIGAYTFNNCESLMSVIIDNSVTSISWNAFSYCTSLESIEIPDSVTSIGGAAFFSCSNLTEITFEGTVDQWNAITKGNDWNFDAPVTFVKCSDGQVGLK